MSMRTTSGRWRRAPSTASRPVAASATTSTSPAAARTARSPARISGSSSATRTRITTAPAARRRSGPPAAGEAHLERRHPQREVAVGVVPAGPPRRMRRQPQEPHRRLTAGQHRLGRGLRRPGGDAGEPAVLQRGAGRRPDVEPEQRRDGDRARHDDRPKRRAQRRAGDGAGHAGAGGLRPGTAGCSGSVAVSVNRSPATPAVRLPPSNETRPPQRGDPRAARLRRPAVVGRASRRTTGLPAVIRNRSPSAARRSDTGAPGACRVAFVRASRTMR
jgi:hypothetical protein